MTLLDPRQAIAHLQPAVWATVNRQLVCKALGEFAHELLIRPTRIHTDGDWGHYLLDIDGSDVTYRFRARILSLDHWSIDPRSIEKRSGEQEEPLDGVRLIIELRHALGIPVEFLPGYLEDVASTLFGAAWKQTRRGLTAVELTRASFQEVESSMTEGHPIFVANNGRIGFSALDLPVYAPEAAVPVSLVWLASHRSRTEFACVDDLSYDELVRQELGPASIEAFHGKLWERGLDPALYLFLPVHPWQWQNKLAQLFAADLATGDLVHLGLGEDRYLAQQSIRTFYNVSHPARRYVKTALSILNMGFTRGIAASIVGSSAAVNDWVAALVRQDPYLGQKGFRLLREVAFVGHRHRSYQRATTKRSDPYKEMLAALWRENPNIHVAPGQRLMTMAALMHFDSEGTPLLTTLIESSAVDVDTWLRRYLDCYLGPLLHCFYAYGLVFTPHCENVILLLEDNVPVGAIIKDIAEDIGVLNPEVELPENVRRLALRVPEEVMTLSIFTDVFDCVFRFLAPILHTHADFPESRFWGRVADCIRDYEQSQPALADKFRKYDLFAPTFIRNCLNRLQLTNNQLMVDLNAAEPVDSLQFVGTLDNPIAELREGAHGTE